MQIRQKQIDTLFVVELSGRFTETEGRGSLLEMIEHLLLHRGARQIVLDLTQATYIDPAGFTEMAHCLGGTLRLEGMFGLIIDPAGIVAETMMRSGSIAVYQIFHSLEEVARHWATAA